MKIFFVIKSLHAAAGTERATIAVANGLAKRNYEVGIVSFVNEGAPFFEVLPEVQLLYLYDKKDKRPSLIRDYSRRVKLRAFYKQYKPDLIIIVGSGRSMLNIPAARGIQNITWEHFNVNINWHLLHPLSKKLAAMYSDCVVTLTKQDAINFKNKYGGQNVLCIPNPVTIDSSVKSPLTEKRVLCIGRLTQQKGYDYLMEAWSKVESRKNGWKLRIIGSGKLLPQVQESIRQLNLEDSIELIPSTDNVVKHYQESSIYVMSSRYEGLPLVLIEAMSMGLPIVSFDCETGPRDIVTHDVTGRLVPPFDTNKLAQELNDLMNDAPTRELYSQNALKNVEKFETEKILDQWELLFKQLKTK